MGDNSNVGLIGLGLVGIALARRLIGAGIKVTGFDIDAARREAFAALGGTAVTSVAEVARDCPRIISAVFNTEQLADVIEGKAGVLDAAAGAPRTVLNVTTSDPDKVAALSARIAPQGVTLLEVPISGTSEQIIQGDGVGLIGGERNAFEACADILDAICPKRYFTGAKSRSTLNGSFSNRAGLTTKGSVAESMV